MIECTVVNRYLRADIMHLIFNVQFSLNFPSTHQISDTHKENEIEEEDQVLHCKGAASQISSFHFEVC